MCDSFLVLFFLPNVRALNDKVLAWYFYYWRTTVLHGRLVYKFICILPHTWLFSTRPGRDYNGKRIQPLSRLHVRLLIKERYLWHRYRLVFDRVLLFSIFRLDKHFFCYVFAISQILLFSSTFLQNLIVGGQ